MYWTLLGFETQVVYHYWGDEFEAAADELIIFDEADKLMLGDTDKFSQLVEKCLVLCFTATPDNFKPDGPERLTIFDLKFKKYYYMIGQDPNKEPELLFDELATCKDVSEKAALITRQAKVGPVLVYGKPLIFNALKDIGCDPSVVDDETDPTSLINLEKMMPNELYKVMVAHD